MTKSNGIASLKQAAKLLNKHSPDGESLAYINPEEARLLRSHGGSGIQTLSGVPSYWSWSDAWDTAKSIGTGIKNVAEWFGYGNQEVDDPDKPGKKKTVPGRSIVNDALSVWGALKAKKDQEGLNAAEMEQFNKLNQQLAAAETEFDVGSDFGAQLKPEYETDITKSAAYTPIDFSGSATPDLTIDAKAYGGRIGAFNGGIQGLMPQQGMPQQGMPQQGFMPQPGLDPRMGYAAHGGRIGYNEGTLTQQQIDQIKQMNGMGSDASTISTITGASIDQINNILNPPVESQAQGGRIGYQEGTHVADLDAVKDGYSELMFGKPVHELTPDQLIELEIMLKDKLGGPFGKKETAPEGVMRAAYGGRIGAQKGGIMPLLDMGGMEKDYRQDGGFVPIGRREKADDVPARLSKNEFVFTADAVKAAGGGDIDEGAQRMYNVMKNLEAGGDISEQSQGQA